MMDADKTLELRKFKQDLGQYKHVLTRQQLRTIKGLAKSGNIAGAYKGLKTILDRRSA